MNIRIYMSEGYPYCLREDDNGETVDDSQKVWWPFDCDDLTMAEAEAACREYFPDDDIEVTN